tara:strand:+ start:102 stop:308 length:207 start_codon:yes stop_codon:yes gene_type:complete
LKKTKFILTLSEDKIPIIAEVDKDRVVGKDERVIGWDCVQANIKKKTFVNIKNKVDYKGRIYAHSESV